MDLLTVKHTGIRANGRYLLRDISFSLQPGQRIALAGETGAGKTSLLKLTGGLLQPDEGQVLYEGERVLGPLEKLIPGHPHIAYLSQYFELRNNYRVEEELESRNKIDPQQAAVIYKVCRIEHLLKRKTSELSGGERQRIVLAALLTTAPGILLLDEPFSNLDAFHKATIRSVLQDINTTLKTAVIMASHDPEDILPWADEIIILKDGELIQQDKPAIVYQRPATEYCAGLLGAYNLVDEPLAAHLLEEVIQFPAGKKLLLRPEEMYISRDRRGAVPGVVEQVQYYGAYHLLLVRTSFQQLLVRDNGMTAVMGEHVWLSPASQKAQWFV